MALLGRERRATSLGPGGEGWGGRLWEKFVPQGGQGGQGERGPGVAAFARGRGGVSCRTLLRTRAARGAGHLGLAVARSDGSPSLWDAGWEGSAPGSPGKSRSPAAPRPPPPPRSCRGLCPAPSQPKEGEAFSVPPVLPSPVQVAARCAPLLPSAPSPEFRQVLGELLAGSFSIAPQPPTSRRLEAGASFSPSPCLAPSLFPTTPPPRGADTPPGGAWPRRSRAQPLFLRQPGPAGRGAARRAAAGTPDRGRWKLREDEPSRQHGTGEVP